MQCQPMPVFGDGSQVRAFSYIDDVAPVIARSPLLEGAYQQVFNVGADKPYTILSLAQEVSRVFDVEPRINYLPACQGVLHVFASHDKIRKLFGMPEPVSLTDGLQRMAGWARVRGAMLPSSFGEIEVPVNLPPFWRT